MRFSYLVALLIIVILGRLLFMRAEPLPKKHPAAESDIGARLESRISDRQYLMEALDRGDLIENGDLSARRQDVVDAANRLLESPCDKPLSIALVDAANRYLNARRKLGDVEKIVVDERKLHGYQVFDEKMDRVLKQAGQFVPFNPFTVPRAKMAATAFVMKDSFPLCAKPGEPPMDMVTAAKEMQRKLKRG